MTKFNPEIQTDLGGGLAARSYGGGSSNEALGSLFKGLAQTAGNFIQGRDAEIRTDISRTASQGADAAVGDLSQFLPGTPIHDKTLPAGLSSAIPNEITAGKIKAQRLADAYRTGQLNDLSYKGQALTLAKQLKTAHPGYEDVIDRTVVSSFSSSPGNQVREELLQQMKSNMTDHDNEVRFRRQEIYKMFSDGVLEPGVTPDMVDVENDQAFHKQMAYGTAAYSEKQQMANKESQLRYKTALDASEKTGMAIDLGNHINKEMDRLMMVKFKKPFEMFMQMNVDGKGLPPEQRAQVLQSLDSVELEARNKLTSLLNTDEWKKVATDKTERDKFINMGLERIGNYRKAIEGEQWDALKVIKNGNDYLLSKNSNDLMNLKDWRGEAWQYIMNQNIPPEIKTLMLQNMAGGVAGGAMTIHDMASSLLTFMTLNGTQPLGQTVEELRKNGVANSPSYFKALGNLSTVLKDPKSNLKELTPSIYGPGSNDLLKNFAGDGKINVFLTLTDPGITQNYKGKPEIAQMLSWSEYQFKQIGNDALNTLRGNKEIFQKLNVTWNPEKQQWDYNRAKLSTLGMSGRGGPGNRSSSEVSSMNAVGKALDTLNTYSGRVSDIAKAAGMDPNQVLRSVYGGFTADEIWQDQTIAPMIHGMLQGGEEQNAEELKPRKSSSKGGEARYQQASYDAGGQVDSSSFITSDRRHKGSAPDIKNVNSELLNRFAAVQQSFGSKIPIVSGYRDAQHNAKVGGAKHSQHIAGNAIDLDVKGMPIAERQRLIKIARENGIHGIGVYPNSLHFDIGGTRAWGPDYHQQSLPDWASAAL